MKKCSSKEAYIQLHCHKLHCSDRINIPDNCQADEFLRSLLHAELISEDQKRKIWPVPVVRVYIYKNQDTKYLLRWIPFEGGLTAAVAIHLQFIWIDIKENDVVKARTITYN
ncbi:hypothetical protein GQX74_005099 [Glossina fuscipes]|nr:hypothetical protein GQX74_005099 [Glossina fuscipes]